nr:MAG TPA_asm: hypothetical protein [Bacteriophage sp.]
MPNRYVGRLNNLPDLICSTGTKVSLNIIFSKYFG